MSSVLAAMRRYWPLVGIVVLALLAETVSLLAARSSTSATVQVPLSSTRLVCAVSPSSTAASELSIVAATGDKQGKPEVSIVPLVEAEGDAVLPELPEALTSPGSRSVGLPARTNPLLVQGTGSLAAGTAASVITVGRKGDDRGLAAQSCEPAGKSWWFVGASSTIGRLSRIVLTNPDASAASVDVRVYTAKGEVEAPAGRGVALAPTSRTELRLDALAPNAPVAAIRVEATTGRVHAGVLLRAVNSLTPLGSEWLPAVIPSTVQLIPIAPGLESVDLSLLQISGEAAPVAITVESASGSFTPVGVDDLTLSAQSVVTVAMEDAVADGGVIRIESARPIVASALGRESTPGKLGDLVAFGSAQAISSTAIVSGLRADAAHALTLSALKGDATVEVTVINGASRTSSTVAVSRYSQQAIAVSAKGTSSVMLTTNKPIIASVISVMRAADGALATSRTLNSRSLTVTQPDARLVIGLR